MSIESTNNQAGVRRVRPGERVRRYLLAEVERCKGDQGRRLPSIRDVALELKVSSFTVHRVFKQLSSEGLIRSRVGNGSFGRKERFSILVNAVYSRSSESPFIPLSTSWNYAIFDGVFRYCASLEPAIQIQPLVLDHEKLFSLDKVSGQIETVDGAILFPGSYVPALAEILIQRKKAVVFLNPPKEQSTTNFVTPDYYGSALRVGRIWREIGKKRVVVVTSSLDVSASNRMRVAGVFCGLDTGASGIDFQVVSTPASDEGNAYQVFKNFVNQKSWIPDAVFCVGDLMALGVVKALREKGVSIPESVSVIGGTGLDLSSTNCPRLTRTLQPLQAMGTALAEMIWTNLRSADGVLPGKVFDTPLIGGGTTSQIENEKLGLAECGA